MEEDLLHNTKNDNSGHLGSIKPSIKKPYTVIYPPITGLIAFLKPSKLLMSMQHHQPKCAHKRVIIHIKICNPRRYAITQV